MRILLSLLLSFVAPILLKGAEETKDSWHITQQKTLPPGYFIEAIGYSKHTETLYAAGYALSNFPVYGWTIGKRRSLRECRALPHGGVQAISCSSDGRVATGSSDRTVKLWSRQGDEVYTSKEEDDQVYTVDFSHDGKELVYGSEKLKLLDCSTYRENLSYSLGAPVKSVRYSSNSNFIAAGLDNGTIQLIDTRTRRTTSPINAEASQNQESYNEPSIYTLDWSLNGFSIVFGGRSGKIYTSDGRSGRIKEFTGHINPDAQDGVAPTSDVYTIKYSPGGKYIVTGSFDTTIKLWDFRRLACLKTLKAHKDSVKSIAWIDDDTFASGSYDGTVKIWTKNNTSVSGDKED